jgi:glucan phosphoethanolaminetransferase (alkaline phosphatase superfamily)
MADDGLTMRLIAIAKPVYWLLFFAVSPLGYVLWNIRSTADALHRIRTKHPVLLSLALALFVYLAVRFINHQR